MDKFSIKDWSAEDRPREKLMAHGSRVLSEAELIAILIGSGTRELSAVELARKILALSNNNLSDLGRLSIKDFMKLKGVGEAKAISISAAMELGRRRAASEPQTKAKIASSSQVFAVFRALLCDLSHEEFWVAFLNRSNLLIDRAQISQGGLTGTVTDVRIIMKKALELNSSSLILCHNHPSGNMSPSEQDKIVTSKIKDAAALFDIQLLDHIIIANNKYLSFADEGII
jgi:DNA repair protein RadC